MAEAKTPHDKNNLQIVSYKVKVGGSEEVDEIYQLHEISIFKKLNKINQARLSYFDGSVEEGEFPMMDSNKFLPGVEISIELGHGIGEDNEIVFEGIISEVEIQTDSEKQPLLKIKCVASTYSMCLNRQFLISENKKDSDIFNDLIDRYDIVAKGKVTQTSFEHPFIVQFGETDWDFLLQRANKIGHIVYFENNQISVKKPNQGKTTLAVTFGTDIIRQQLTFSTKSIISEVKSSSWNPADQALRTEISDKIDFPEPGDDSVSDSASLGEKFMQGSQTLLTHADEDNGYLMDKARGQLLQYELNKINGYVVVEGSHKPKLDSVLEINKLGRYFSGEGYISGVDHKVKDGKWTTKVHIGVPTDIFSSISTPSSHPLSSLQIGVIEQIHDDPEGNQRVLVSIPGFEVEGSGIWARVLQWYTSAEAGNVFYPEVGTEVVLGYLSADPQSPIVLGSLYNAKNIPPFDVEEANNIKAFISREKLSLTFDEEKKEILLETPERNAITISDDLGGIRLEDQHGNKLILDDAGITLESSSDLYLRAKGELNVQAERGFSVKSRGDIKLEGMNLSSNANMKIEHKGNIVESNATAQMVIKGGIVQIN